MMLIEGAVNLSLVLAFLALLPGVEIFRHLITATPFSRSSSLKILPPVFVCFVSLQHDYNHHQNHPGRTQISITFGFRRWLLF